MTLLTKKSKNKELSLYVNKQAIVEVLGSFLQQPELMKEYKVTTGDFVENFHKLIFAAIANLYKSGAKVIDAVAIDDYLSHYEAQYKVFTTNNGMDYIEQITTVAQVSNIRYYYDQIKKFTLLRRYVESGFDVTDFYDPYEIEPKIIEEHRELLDKSSVFDIINHFKQLQIEITSPFLLSEGRDSKKAGVGGLEQKERWKKSTAWGIGYSSAYLTTITHGLKGGKYTVKSASSGVGKTRTAISDLCYACSPKYYDKKRQMWCENPNGLHNGGLYIGTEMELLEEIDPILWAYIADVPQEHIKYNCYEDGEEERVDEAIRILSEEANIWLEYVPQYDVSTLESVIEEHKIKHNVKYVWFDYIHTTVELISEFSSQSKTRMVAREDQILAALSNKLKNICRQYNISLDTCTQVSGDFRAETNRDESIVRGAKAIIDKTDVALIAMPPTKLELKRADGIIRRLIGTPPPNLIYSVYKNRGGKWKRVKIWLYVDYDTMRVHDLFVTDYDDQLIEDITKTYINVVSEDENNAVATETPVYKPFSNIPLDREKAIVKDDVVF